MSFEGEHKGPDVAGGFPGPILSEISRMQIHYTWGNAEYAQTAWHSSQLFSVAVTDPFFLPFSSPPGYKGKERLPSLPTFAEGKSKESDLCCFCKKTLHEAR